MNRTRLVLRSLWQYRRTNAGIALGAAVAAAIVVGALLVGGSVNHSLRQLALTRMGRVSLAMIGGDRFFRDALAGDLRAAAETGECAPAILLRGVASRFDAGRRAGAVNVLGIDERFARLGYGPWGDSPPARGEVLLSEALAERLDVLPGEDILVRVERPMAMPADAVLAPTDEASLGLRLRVRGIVPADAFGNFGLEAAAAPPLNAFLSLHWLQEELDLAGRANLMLVGGEEQPTDPGPINRAVRQSFTLADVELDLRAGAPPGVTELTSDRVFIDGPVPDALASLELPALGVLTYFVNELRSADRATPYSMVAALGPLGATRPPALDAILPVDLRDDEIVINDWLAHDLEVGPGDAITLRYFVPGPGRRLVEESATFTVRVVVPLGGPTADPSLMPDFPGISGSEHCRDWEPGIPIDLERIRDEDERYWDEHRGTPKAFVTLAAGQRLWGNRFGSLTAVRVAQADGAALEQALRAHLDPAKVGLFFQDVRAAALAAGGSSTDFGGLFLGLSVFLVAAALLLVALLFVFSLEQRAAELGTLLAVGFRPAQVRTLLLMEGGGLAVVGAALGMFAGVAYTWLILAALRGAWSGAVASAPIALHVRPATMLVGGAAAILAAGAAIWLALRGQVRTPIARLLAGSAGAAVPSHPGRPRRAGLSLLIAVVCALGAAGIVLVSGADRGRGGAGAFFGAGSLLLIATLALSRALFAALARHAGRRHLSLAGLGVRSTSRRPGRSLATAAILACGAFLVMAVSVNRLDATRDARSRSSGTGGFALFAQATLPVLEDFETVEGLRAAGLQPDEAASVSIVPMRVRDGDDASCLNLSVARSPRLLGVRPRLLADRGAFSFARTVQATDSPWLLLEREAANGAIPAIGDDASVTWSMRKGIGDTVDYLDERGGPFQVRIVATVAPSILQGSLLVDETQFERLFPSESGYRAFLIDAPPESAERVSRTLSRAFEHVGLEVLASARRLAAFNAVQNTYLSIFQVLGGLGLLLGSAGLGMVVLRNVLERRGELAVLSAVGFSGAAVRWLLLSEHALLLGLGLACGALAALVAAIPALRGAAAEVPLLPAAGLVLIVAIAGLAWVWLGTALATRGRLLDALRND